MRQSMLPRSSAVNEGNEQTLTRFRLDLAIHFEKRYLPSVRLIRHEMRPARCVRRDVSDEGKLEVAVGDPVRAYRSRS